MNTSIKLDPLYSSVWRLFITANAKLLDRIEEKLVEVDLPSLEWYDVLLTLKEANDQRLRLSDLAEQVLLSRSNLTRLIDRMEEAGLLHRKPCPNDRRGTFAVLSEAGLAMQERMWVVYAEGINEFFACHLSEEEAVVLQRILQQIIASNI